MFSTETEHLPMSCNVYPCAGKKGLPFCCDCFDFPCDYLHPYADQAKLYHKYKGIQFVSNKEDGNRRMGAKQSWKRPGCLFLWRVEAVMGNCDKCKRTVSEEDGRKHISKRLCEDCYIDEVMPKMSKAHYDNDAEFMQRLQNPYSVHPQKYH